jgi:putative membrane-bound dehydrogenase-like protein
MASRTHVLVALGAPIAFLALVLSRGAAFVADAQSPATASLTIRHDQVADTVAVHRAGGRQPILVANAPADARPYLHPIAAPDGRGVVTEFSPGHHPHQTGLYWGHTRVNGRDYFHNRGGDYWRRVSASVTRGEAGRGAEEVRWETVYDLLDATGQPVLTETQRWTMRERDGRFILGLEWRGEARTGVVIGRYDYGGLFLRMPWTKGIAGDVVNAARQQNERAEGQRAMWIDVGMPVEGRSDLAHVAIFDHPANTGYPQRWRVDSQLGVGSARQRDADFTLAKGALEVLRHQFVIYTGTLSDVALTDLWSDFSGSRGLTPTSALWSIAQREGRDAPSLTPNEAVAQMTLADGFTVNAWAAEPAIAQPMAFTWDDRGRLWVAENLDYETRGRGFSNDGRSRIVILEDADRDGVAERRTVFMEGIIFPSALAVGFDGVFVGAPPNLLFIPDRDGDDKADLDAIEVRLTGWGIQDRHEVMNSFHWGPDGWLYGLQGYATNSNVRKPVGKGRLFARDEPFPSEALGGEGVRINGGVWRYHPTKDVFEVVAHGFSNPWGIDHDAKGQIFITACVIPHLWHVVPGGIYQRQGGQHFNPYVYADIQTIADHRHRSAHGGARIYQSDAFPASERGRVFMANIHEHAVLADVVERRGSGFVARHGQEVLLANNAHWIGFSLEVGPDGALYVLDWHDPDICGNAVLHKDTGRIYRIAPAMSRAEAWDGRYADLSRLSDRQLVDLQTSPSDWHARRARVLLQGRAASGRLSADTHEALRQMFRRHDHPDVRLRAMWSLQVTGGWTPEALIQTLGDRDEYVRAWAVQFLTEDRSPSAAVLGRFARLARDDRSPVVRLYLASALQRVDPAARWPIAAPLLQRAEDAGDHNLPTMLWLGVEPLVAGGAAQALAHAAESRVPQVARFIARRLVDADRLDPLVAAIAREPRTVASLLDGMRDGLAGRTDVTPPVGWPAALARLERSNRRIAAAATEVARHFGDAETTQRNLATVRDWAAPMADRRRALVALATQRRAPLAAEVPALLEVPALRVEAIRAVAAFDSAALGKVLLSRYSSLSEAERAEAVQALASRPTYGRLLTMAIAAGSIPRRDVPPHIARQLRRVVGTQFTMVWGPVEPNALEDHVLAKYRTLLTDRALAAASAGRGHTLFQQTCGTCHQLYGEGGTVGPDLTGSNRVNLDYLLLNVLDPNADVPEAYRMVVITTRDGRTLAGNVLAETERQVTLRTVGQEPVLISTADIQSREVTPSSLMPAGLLDGLTDAEVLDLVAYLRTTEPAAGR